MVANRWKQSSVNLAFWTILIAEVAGDIPGCEYFDTVDLTKSHRFDNGSYLYDDILISKEQVGNYSKQYFFNGDVQDVPEHPRGCVCQDKRCIQFCSESNLELDNEIQKCENTHNGKQFVSSVKITLDSGEEVESDLKSFTISKHMTCKKYSSLDSEWSSSKTWTLFENGSLLRHINNEMLTKADYCMKPHLKYNSNGTLLIYKVSPNYCIRYYNTTITCVQFVSICFMILITVVYLILPNFRSVYGKCCICYFICSSLGISLFIVGTMHWVDAEDGQFICYLVGCIGYIAIISSFLWLLIINFNLWKTFQNIGVAVENRFLEYNIFVWSVTSILFAITILAETTGLWTSALIKSKTNPNFISDVCWINTSRWSGLIYYYGPLLILITINFVLFIKTAMRIIIQNRDNRRQLDQSECQRQIKKLSNYVMLFRLFMIVGVVWIFDIITYVCFLHGIDTKWTIYSDYITSSQGIILFVVTILKKDVLKALGKRLRGKPQNHSELCTTKAKEMTA